jgi:hypothetical protein
VDQDRRHHLEHWNRVILAEHVEVEAVSAALLGARSHARLRAQIKLRLPKVPWAIRRPDGKTPNLMSTRSAPIYFQGHSGRDVPFREELLDTQNQEGKPACRVNQWGLRDGLLDEIWALRIQQRV